MANIASPATAVSNKRRRKSDRLRSTTTVPWVRPFLVIGALPETPLQSSLAGVFGGQVAEVRANPANSWPLRGEKDTDTRHDIAHAHTVENFLGGVGLVEHLTAAEAVFSASTLASARASSAAPAR